MSSFVEIFKNILGGQMLVRLCSFLFNFILVNIVDPSVLGFFNVRLNLLYNTIGFLSREPVRKLCLGSNVLEKEMGIYSVFSPVISILAISIFYFIWFFSWRNSELELGTLAYSSVLAVFCFSIFLEVIVEPFIIEKLKVGSTGQYVRNNAILIFSQKCITLVLILLGINEIVSFTLAQLIASFFYVLLFIYERPMRLVKTYTDAFYLISQNGLDNKCVLLLKTFIAHSFLKQFLTDGANFLMTFTNILPLKLQAVYDAVERLGSLVVRLVLQPLEESAAIYFSINMKKEEKISNEIANTFILFTRLIFIFGISIMAFGSNYASLAAQLYGGKLFIDNQADQLLFCYSIYIPVIAINGLSECFAVSLLNAQQLYSHAKFFVFSVIAHLLTSYFFCNFFGAKGFIIANILNYLIRIWFNWQFIKGPLQTCFNDTESIPKKLLLPTRNFAVSLSLTWIILFTFSNVVFPGRMQQMQFQAAHVLIGILLLTVDAYVFYRNDFKKFREIKLKTK